MSIELKRYILFITSILGYCLLAMATGETHFSVSLSNRWSRASSQDIYHQANIYNDNGEFDSAFVLLNIVANRFDENKQNDDERQLSIGCMATMGNYLQYKYLNYPKSYKYLSKAVKLSEQYGYDSIADFANLSLANLYGTFADMTGHQAFVDTSIVLLKKAFNIAYRIQDWEGVVNAAYDMVSSLKGRPDIDLSAIAHEIELLNNVPRTTPYLAYTQAYYLMEKAMREQDYNKALEQIEIMHDSLDGNNEAFRLNYYGDKAKVLLAMKQYQQALQCINVLQDVCDNGGHLDLLAQVYNTKSLIYNAQGDKSNGDKYMLEALQIKEKLLNEHQLVAISSMPLLEQINEDHRAMQVMAQQRDRQYLTIVIISGFLIVVMGFLFWLSILYKRLREEHEQLYLKMQQMLKTGDIQYIADVEPEVKEADIDTTENEVSTRPSNATNDEIEIKIKQAMLDNDLICSYDFSIKELANAIGEKERDVSQVINDKYHCNFNNFLAVYRVREACRRIDAGGEYDQLTIEAIANSVGIKSRTNFAVVFKRVTGLSPSEYIRIAHKKRIAS